MAAVRFSKLAEIDLLQIASYTLERWGAAQAARYLDLLETACERTADKRSIGHPCKQIRPGLWRLGAGRHVIFYRFNDDGITVSRILHERMLPSIHAMED